MKKQYNELVKDLCDFHTIALLDFKKNKNTKNWKSLLTPITKKLYQLDYNEFLVNFPVDKPIIMPGVLEAHYNFLNAVIQLNENLTSIAIYNEIYECALDVKRTFDNFLYINKYKIHRSKTNSQFEFYDWYNILPLI